MDSLLGRGRGRGAGRGLGRGKSDSAQQRNKTPWQRQSNHLEHSISKEQNQIRENMIRLAAQCENDYESSSEDELEDDVILNKTFEHYKEIEQGEASGSDNHHYLLEVLQSGALSCLVCIESVKRNDPIWNCVQCSSIFHLQCIQKWAREGVGRQALQTEGDISKLDLRWHCPKCRHEYSQRECPTRYMCFCGKEENPTFDPWIVPHSCGQKCMKLLVPECGHDCLLLCHPGPCPPCPKTVRVRCHCGKAAPALKRCSQKDWSCNSVCNKRLACQRHNCQSYCHKGECPPCPEKSDRLCMCGKNTSLRDCADPVWSCDEVCRKNLPCGHHICEKVCHAKSCGDCPRAGKRSCPCGKTISVAPCTEDVPTCEDTCLKQMNCKKHECSKRCHYGPCETCLQVVEKTCRCGKRKKELPCRQDFFCDIKCTNLRSCGRHPCKRKCCDGNCPPCEQVCNRTLGCRNHKCPSPCHPGVCYPCNATKKVSCFCGATYITVPCGKEKTTKPPRCRQFCKNPSKCHHETQKPHRCHFNRCPPCRQKCEKKYDSCKHVCQESCHDQVFDQKAKEASKMRHNSKKNDDIFFVAIPCPPCTYLVEKLCLGEHEKRSFPCSELKSFSCKRECGRLLPCENHTCVKECHLVKGTPVDGKAGRNCSRCEEMCTKRRPDGCIHDCKRACHPGECPPCEAHVKLDCHCQSIKLYIKCCEYTMASSKEKREMLCCKGRCTKILECGHLCARACHTGSCTNAGDCMETTKIKCPCGRRKKAVPCSDARSGKLYIRCDEKCEEMKLKKKQENIEKEETRRAAELKKQQEELAWFERKKQGRKRKQRQHSETDAKVSTFQRHKYLFVVSVLLVSVAVILATYLNNI